MRRAHVLKKPVVKKEYRCDICGDLGKVPAMYLDNTLGLKEGRKLEDCVCRGGKRKVNEQASNLF